MPITFHVDHQLCLVATLATGIVSRHDVLRHLREKEDAGVAAYAQLFDAIDVQLDLSIRDLDRIAGEARRLARGRTPGSVAVVTHSFYIHALATVYHGLTRGDHPGFKIFKDVASARAWLAETSMESNDGRDFDVPRRPAQPRKIPKTRTTTRLRRDPAATKALARFNDSRSTTR